jgi:Tol biopolymer transport system component
MLEDEMMGQGFGALVLPAEMAQPMPAKADVLSVAAAPQSPVVYFELTGIRSQIFRLSTENVGSPDAVPEYVADGYDPAISDDGRWFAYLRQGRDATTIFFSKDGAPAAALPSSSKLDGVLEMSVTPDGNLIVATGGAADPHLSILDTASGEVRPLADIHGAVRYPAISADGQWLAFSRRESGSWHLFVRDLAHGTERQLTSAACNATSPAWEDAQTLLYVSDCGRGLALSAPARGLVQRVVVQP